MQDIRYLKPAQNASGIAQRLGLHRAGRGWRGTCPSCGYREALALDERDGRPLLWCASGCPQPALVALLRDTGGPPERHAEAERLGERIEHARALWSGGEPLTANCPAGLYLAHRKIAHVIGSPALRWRMGVPHPNGGRRLALLAAITGPDGALQGVQRIFLDRDGRKADVVPVKATLGPMAGGAVRLQPASTELAVAEGLESAASAGLLLGLPSWSAISAGNLARGMLLPPGIRSVVIAADHDEPGLRAAEAAATRWRDEGRAVRIIRACEPGCDANDILREAGHDPA